MNGHWREVNFRDDAKMTVMADRDFKRQTLANQVGPVPHGLAPVLYNGKDPETMAYGAASRVLQAIPEFNEGMLMEFKEFNERLIDDLFDKLGPIEVPMSRQEYIDSRLWSGSKKAKYQRIFDDMSDVLELPSSWTELSSFTKTEFYTKLKSARSIQGRDIRMNIIFGPYVLAMQHYLERTGWIIKKVPVRQRPEYIEDKFGHFDDATFVVTDHTRFEAAMCSDLQLVCEAQFFSRCFPENPTIDSIIDAFTGINHCTALMGRVRYETMGVRMSGDPHTSLGNSWTNYAAFAFACEKLQLNFDGVVEGDDGLFAVDQDFSLEDMDNIFRSLGFQLKATKVRHPSVAGFCGLYWDPSTMTTVRDPTRALLTLGWSFSADTNASLKLRKQLARAKALSLLAEAPCTPILAVLAFRLLDLTKGIKARIRANYWSDQTMKSMGLYEYEKGGWIYLNENIPQQMEIPESARQMMEECFGIDATIQKMQERILAQVGLFDQFDVLFDMAHEDSLRRSYENKVSYTSSLLWC